MQSCIYAFHVDFFGEHSFLSKIEELVLDGKRDKIPSCNPAFSHLIEVPSFILSCLFLLFKLVFCQPHRPPGHKGQAKDLPSMGL